MNTNLNVEVELDNDWILLLLEAKDQGMTVEDIKEVLRTLGKEVTLVSAPTNTKIKT